VDELSGCAREAAPQFRCGAPAGTPRMIRLRVGTKEYVNSGVVGNFRNEVSPSAGKRAAPDLDAFAERCYAGPPDGPLKTEPVLPSNMSSDVDSRSL